MRYSESFYLDLLGFLKNKFPTFYWGQDEDGYYWGDSEEGYKFIMFDSLQQLVDSISKYLKIE